jgi:hypothetical protein
MVPFFEVFVPLSVGNGYERAIGCSIGRGLGLQPGAVKQKYSVNRAFGMQLQSLGVVATQHGHDTSCFSEALRKTGC